MAVKDQKCSSCRHDFPCTAEHFKPTFGTSGIEYIKTCHGCAKKGCKRSRKYRERAKAKKDAVPTGEHTPRSPSPAPGPTTRQDSDPGSDDATDFLGLKEVSLDAFLGTLAKEKEVITLSAFVSLTGVEGDMDQRVDTFRRTVWDQLSYRFKYVHAIHLGHL
ncbi:hypothetical protein CPB85DRAFT_1258653 [Mucidula mucida]|nr:hypothetical protein CPB85DRAFT_1258653 [Mucidula mucida]